MPVTWNLTFDPGADRQLDTLQGCWQVGGPAKAVFDSAWSVPNALVTDTVSPYPVGGMSYAEFSVPVYFLGEEVVIEFRQRLDMDSTDASGWVEWYDALNSGSWIRVEPGEAWYSGWIEWTGDGLDTDSGLVFTGTNNGWGQVQLAWRCIAVLESHGTRAMYPDSMRFRFAFRSQANNNGKDGWMIDDLVLTNNGCWGGVEARTRAEVTVFPNPVQDHLFIERNISGPWLLELYHPDGTLIRRERTGSRAFRIDVTEMPPGPYLLHVSDATTRSAHQVMVIH